MDDKERNQARRFKRYLMPKKISVEIDVDGVKYHGLVEMVLKPFPAPSSLIDDFLIVYDGVGDIDAALYRLSINKAFSQNEILPGPAWETIEKFFMQDYYNQDEETAIHPVKEFYRVKYLITNLYLAIKDMRKAALDFTFQELYPELKRRVRGWIYNYVADTTEKKFRSDKERLLPIPEAARYFQEDPETGLTEIELEINSQLSEYPWLDVLYFEKVAIYGAVKRLPEKEQRAWLIQYGDDLLAYLDDEIDAPEAYNFDPLTDEEEAKRDGVTEAAIRKRRERAMDKIRDYLSDNYPLGLDYLED